MTTSAALKTIRNDFQRYHDTGIYGRYSVLGMCQAAYLCWTSNQITYTQQCQIKELIKAYAVKHGILGEYFWPLDRAGAKCRVDAINEMLQQLDKTP
jgi:diketogulonate reductase-like aldo/keto reductase